MHPAPSIILFTVCSGLGYGLAVMLGLGLLDPAALATKLAHVLALALIGGGLLSSTLHLGNPQRAWRAFSQWRSSWLSREGVMAVATFVPLTLAAALALFADRFWLPLALVGAAMAVTTVYCTAMIYASLRTVEAWATPLTPACYVAFSLAGGALLATLFAALGGGAPRGPGLAALLLLAVAWVLKRAWKRRQSALASASTPATATGLGAIGTVRLLERPHMTENYLTREMGFKVARKHAAKLWRIALGLGLLVPAAGLAVLLAAPQGTPATVAAALACLGFVAGLLVERWLFFAEARHAVMNYY
ncbi:DmsC/YnfH family molybdoenzyme membrane anchor subunit [Aquibium sp. ELW1220]|uniref:dimethyl sulfoxide reductase anchor subunit family protein n=1 Tax=Aquibium sp. ELW1220 TaxID=2976766 RepID=UPI0025B16666|nr:DmsC/YnfH family molybdoenzyme membrane anchor subunit [Aquibium sp. ELW1220]MDN2583133.1 dimethyl sulfoxide reductase anchor subunit [Aquibium sp. ELW1220]